MKKAMLLLLLTLAACWLALLLPACHKDPPDPPVPPPVVLPDTLPPLTTVGANTFGCYVNGKLWLPKADWKAYFDPSFQMFESWLKEGEPPQGGYVEVMHSVEGVRQLFSFGIPCKTGILHTNVPDAVDPDDFSVYYLDFKKSLWYYPDRSAINTMNRLRITHLDTVNNIVSGTFNFTLYRSANGNAIVKSDSMRITDGRFDIRYH